MIFFLAFFAHPKIFKLDSRHCNFMLLGGGFCSIFLKNAGTHIGKQLSYLGFKWTFWSLFFFFLGVVTYFIIIIILLFSFLFFNWGLFLRLSGRVQSGYNSRIKASTMIAIAF